MLKHLDDDEERLQKLIELFTENTPQIMESIRAAITRHNSAGLEKAAHKLLSSLGAFGAAHARDLASGLEKQGERKDFKGADEKFAEPQKRLVRFTMP
jgi:HPt (histidine-containing phosphotransfer) domain-containing protein